MSCKTDACRQGREPCPTPWACADGSPYAAAMSAPIQREAMHRIPNEWDREQADTPLYSPDFVDGLMHGLAVVGWALLWIATIAFACGGAALAGMALLDWLEPHWPALVSMVTP